MEKPKLYQEIILACWGAGGLILFIGGLAGFIGPMVDRELFDHIFDTYVTGEITPGVYEHGAAAIPFMVLTMTGVMMLAPFAKK